MKITKKVLDTYGLTKCSNCRQITRPSEETRNRMRRADLTIDDFQVRCKNCIEADQEKIAKGFF